MRTIEYAATTHVPAFLTKLWKLVTDVSCDELISWSLAGTSFIIYDEIRFSKELLPMYFKHNNMASFVRQLNMYGFRKLSCIDQGGMNCYKNEIEFYHQYFLKGQESLLELIKRKIPNSKSDEPKVKQEYIDELISNIKSLKGKQDYAEQGMRHLRRENKMLWRHVSLLTDRYSKQQSVLQQLLPFFMNMINSSREIAMKRKAALMFDEGDTPNKIARLSPSYYVQHSQDSNPGMPSSPGNVSNRGPVIHDVTEVESSKMFHSTILSNTATTTTTTKECEVDSPLSGSLESSEQTIDTPFTEPGSMETLNILNQNYERRSRSNSHSSCIEMSRSPISIASTSSLGLASPDIIPSPPSSTYTPSTSATSPTIIIDETTSDVPLPGGLMASTFMPKIEDTCTDSGMYTMSSMMNETVSSMMSERVASIIDEETVSLLSEATPAMMAAGSSSLNNASVNNKYNPSSFMPNMKNSVPEMNWMMNQPAPSYASEPSFDNWLGQIFKADNLTAGCSLPQPQEPTGTGHFV